jgi:Lipoxygenase
MSQRSAPGGGRDVGARIGRRGFIGVGLAGAGAALIPPSAAANAAAPASTNGSASENQQSVAASSSVKLSQLPLRSTHPYLPAVPVDPAGVLDTLGRLKIRVQQEIQAKQGLVQQLRINGRTATAYAFLYGGTPQSGLSAFADDYASFVQAHPGRVRGDLHDSVRNGGDRSAASAGAAAPQPLTLESPEQFSISWTRFPDVYGDGLPFLPAFSASLTDPDAATRQFWPMIAEHGTGFNLIIPERVTPARARNLRGRFGTAWTRRVRAALAAGNLYAIDISLFETLQPQSMGVPRFTPGTVVLLTRNPRTKSLTPVAIVVSGYKGRGRRVYTRAGATDGAWLYALQAAKASVTLYGIWLGHVYHWHIVTAAMQMTMLNTVPATHPIYRLLAPHCKYAIAFDDVLLKLWSSIAPPTSVASADQFLALCNRFATGRTYFDDDPLTTLARHRLRQRDFSINSPWDQYPVVRRLLAVWDLVAAYISTFVRTTYSSDAGVAGDQTLQTWIATAGSSNPTTGGNIRGLPRVTTRAALRRVLTSFLYRITIHGVSRLSSTSNPALTFVSNFPHCLQRTDIPGPRARIGTKRLLSYLPNTDTIGQAVGFYFIFAFSTPYEPYIPLGGVDTQLYFPGGTSDARNRALIELRNGLASFIGEYDPAMPQRFQWPRNIET